MFRKILSLVIVDMRLRTNYKHYVLQSLLIFVCVGLVLLLCEFFDSIIAASLGASSFILFVSPHTNSSRARYVIGGYISGALSGVLFNLIYNWLFRMSGDGRVYAFIAFRAASVAVASFIMIVLDLEHPPAAALALGLTGETECIEAAAAAVAGVALLCLLRRILKKYLIDLI